MKRLITFITILLLVFSVPLFAVETNYDQAVSADYNYGGITYNGTVTFSDSGSGDIYYTQWMCIGFVDKSKYGWLDVVCSEVGTEDVNVFFEYSNDCYNTYLDGTDSDLDAVGTTAVQDTVGIYQGTASEKYASFGWVRLKFVAGQAINATTVTWSFELPILERWIKHKTAYFKSRETS